MERPGFPEFMGMLESLLQERNSRYGTKNIAGPAQVHARAEDKMARISNAIRDGGQPTAQDWADLAGYSAIGWLLERGLWDGRSTLRRVYYAHPHGVEHAKWEATFDMLHRDLSAKFAVYRPVGPFANVAGHADWVWPVCLQAIDLADMLVGVLPGPSNGVAAEMLYAKTRGKTVWALALTQEMARSSLVQYAADRLFTDIAGLVSAVNKAEVGNAVSADKETA